MTNRLWVTLHILWRAVSLQQTASKWHCIFCERRSHCVFSYDQQQVSDIAHLVKGGLIASFPMTNREWVDIAHFVKGSLIASFPMINSMWVTLNILWKAVSLHLFLWPTGSEWHCTFCEGWSHCIFSYDQQVVSDIEHFVKGSLTSFPMANSLWVTLHILWKAVSLHLFLWPTGSKWYCTFCERQSHCIFPYDQQGVSWHCTFCERQSHCIISYDQQGVSDITHFVKGSLIASFPMTNRLWVTLHILWKAVSLHLSLWPIACEWHWTFCERQPHCIFSMTNSEWVTLHICKKQSHQLHLFL